MMRTTTQIALSLLLTASACGTDMATPDAAGGLPTLSSIQSGIFDHSCAFGSCHNGASPAAKLDLHSTAACRALVVHTSCLFPNKMLVVPGSAVDPDRISSSPDRPSPGRQCSDPRRLD